MLIFDVRPYKSGDFRFVEEWISKRGLQKQDQAFYPPNGRTIVHEETLICVGFLTKTDAGYSAIGNFMSNPDVSREIRHEAMNLLIQELLELSRNNGFLHVAASSNNKKLLEFYKENGFAEVEEGLTVFIRGL